MSTRANTPDLLSHLGPLAFATRLRRLGEWLQRDVTRVYEELGIPFQARWFAVLWRLKDGKSRSITELASDLKLSHPAINQTAESMFRHGLLESRKDRQDERRRLLRLTKSGRDLFALLNPVLTAVRQETELLLGAEAPKMLVDLNRIEKSLVKINMYARVRERLKRQQLDKVKILPYRPEFKRTFRKLNLEWLREYFTVEPEDEKILRDPERAIIRAGGEIIMAELDGRIVGTTALLRHTDAVFEIAKMAVTKSVRGQQAGRKLAVAALAIARQKGASRVILHTSPKLTEAAALYKSLGFKEEPLEPEFRKSFRRATIAMEFELKPNTRKKTKR